MSGSLNLSTSYTCSLGGDPMVPSPWNPSGLQILLYSCGHLEPGLYLCWDGMEACPSSTQPIPPHIQEQQNHFLAQHHSPSFSQGSLKWYQEGMVIGLLPLNINHNVRMSSNSIDSISSMHLLSLKWVRSFLLSVSYFNFTVHVFGRLEFHLVSPSFDL